MALDRIFGRKSGMGEVPIRLEDRIPAWWEMAGTVPEILDARNTEFLERDLYLEHICNQNHPLADTVAYSESRHGYSVFT